MTKEQLAKRAERAKAYYWRNRRKCLDATKRSHKKYKEKIAYYMKQWRLKNKKEIEKYNRTYSKSHRDRINENARNNRRSNPVPHRIQNRQWRENNRPKDKAMRETWLSKNKKRVKIFKQRYQVKRRYSSLAFPLSYLDWIAIKKIYNNRCAYCKSQGNLVIEHMTPLSRGGTNHPSNLVPSCQSCNGKKWARTAKEFMPSFTIHPLHPTPELPAHSPTPTAQS